MDDAANVEMTPTVEGQNGVKTGHVEAYPVAMIFFSVPDIRSVRTAFVGIAKIISSACKRMATSFGAKTADVRTPVESMPSAKRIAVTGGGAITVSAQMSVEVIGIAPRSRVASMASVFLFGA